MQSVTQIIFRVNKNERQTIANFASVLSVQAGLELVILVFMSTPDSGDRNG
jgi:hypothetical protein